MANDLTREIEQFIGATEAGGVPAGTRGTGRIPDPLVKPRRSYEVPISMPDGTTRNGRIFAETDEEFRQIIGKRQQTGH